MLTASEQSKQAAKYNIYVLRNKERYKNATTDRTGALDDVIIRGESTAVATAETHLLVQYVYRLDVARYRRVQHAATLTMVQTAGTKHRLHILRAAVMSVVLSGLKGAPCVNPRQDKLALCTRATRFRRFRLVYCPSLCTNFAAPTTTLAASIHSNSSNCLSRRGKRCIVEPSMLWQGGGKAVPVHSDTRCEQFTPLAQFTPIHTRCACTASPAQTAVCPAALGALHTP